MKRQNTEKCSKDRPTPLSSENGLDAHENSRLMNERDDSESTGEAASVRGDSAPRVLHSEDGLSAPLFDDIEIEHDSEDCGKVDEEKRAQSDADQCKKSRS